MRYALRLHPEQWDKAHQDFFEAFKNYDEAGSNRRIQCLKYLVLANMLMLSEIDPFTAAETKPFKNDPEITAMTNLVSAYQRNEILEFEKILRGKASTRAAGAATTTTRPGRAGPRSSSLTVAPRAVGAQLTCVCVRADNRKTIMDDPFVRNYIEDLLRNIRTQVVLKLIKPYTQVTIAFLAKVRSPGRSRPGSRWSAHLARASPPGQGGSRWAGGRRRSSMCQRPRSSRCSCRSSWTAASMA